MIDMDKIKDIAGADRARVSGLESGEEYGAQKIGLDFLQWQIDELAGSAIDYEDLAHDLRDIANFPHDLLSIDEFDGLASEYAEELAAFGQLDETANSREIDLSDKWDRHLAAEYYLMDIAAAIVSSAAYRVIDELEDMQRKLDA